MGSAKILEILLDNRDIFNNCNLWINPILALGWLLIKALYLICFELEKLVTSFLNNINFWNYGPVQDFLNSIKPVIWIFFALGLALLFMWLMFSKGKPKNQIISNLLLVFLIVTSMPTIMGQMEQLTNATIGVVNSNDSLTSQAFTNSITDLVYLDSLDFDAEKIKQSGKKNNLSNEDVLYIDILDLVDPTKDVKNRQLFEHKLQQDETGNWTAVADINGGIFGVEWLGNRYYRYHIDWLSIIVTTLSLAIALFLTFMKVGRLVFELGFNQGVLMLVAPFDLISGRRIKEGINAIIGTFASLVLIAMAFKFFLMYQSWVTSMDINAVWKSFNIACGAFGLIMGPELPAKLFGVDLGLCEGGSMMSSIFYGARMTKNAVTGLGKGLKSGAEKTSKAAGHIMGGIAGVTDADMDRRQKSNIPENPSTKDNQNKELNNKDKNSLPSRDIIPNNTPDGDNYNNDKSKVTTPDGNSYNNDKSKATTPDGNVDNSNINSSNDNVHSNVDNDNPNSTKSNINSNIPPNKENINSNVDNENHNSAKNPSDNIDKSNLSTTKKQDGNNLHNKDNNTTYSDVRKQKRENGNFNSTFQISRNSYREMAKKGFEKQEQKQTKQQLNKIFNGKEVSGFEKTKRNINQIFDKKDKK